MDGSGKGTNDVLYGGGFRDLRIDIAIRVMTGGAIVVVRFKDVLPVQGRVAL